ncbi:MAG: hypothetical protein JST16_10285 [Bdellovibrionales bacterium]|nr:hypothetical protein [Bdellovibrionales bacterium]
MMMRLSLLALPALSLCLASCTGKKKDDGTLRLYMLADAKQLDPALVQDLYSNWISSLSYEGLLEYHYLKRPFELKPNLAEAMPTVSKDGLTYTFKIRKGIHFMDSDVFPGGKGREVKAQDFVYSFLRVADPKLGSGQFWVYDGHIKGLNEWRDKQKTNATVDYDHPPEGFKAVDDYTLQIKLNHKYAQLLFVLAMPTGFVVPHEAVEKLGKDFGNNLVGTGPYKLVNWMRNSKLSFVKNPNYRGEPYPAEGEASDAANGLLADAGKMMPLADKLEYHIFVESQPRWLNFLKGSIDVTQIPKDNFDSMIDKNTHELLPDQVAKGIRLMKAPQPEISYIAFNMEDPVIKKGGPNLRKAIALAIDQKKTSDILFWGTPVLGQFLLPPALAGYEESFVNPYNQHNVEKAKELLAKAGYPGGQGLPELVYEVPNGTDSRQLAELFQKYVGEIGIKVRVNYNQFSELDEKIIRKKAQMWGIAWMADYPDAENFLQLLYGPNSAPGPNGSNFNNPEYNKLYDQMRVMQDSPARRAIINKMRDIYIQEMPIIVERHRVFYYTYHNWLKNFKMEYMGGSIAKYLRVDSELRSKGN